MKKYFQHFPLHSFLVGIYFIYFIFVNNYHEVTLQMIWRSVIASLILALIIFGFCYLVLRRIQKAAVFTTVLLTGFYTYGYVYFSLTDVWSGSHLHRYLITGFILTCVVLFYLIWRTGNSLKRLNHFLNILILAILAVNTFFLFQVSRTNVSNAGNPFLQNIPLTAVNSHIRKMPDVYYIVLDGYASENVLRDFYNYPDPLLYKFLKEKGFYIADSSSANYFDTSPSLSSTLNLNYLPQGRDEPVMIRENLANRVFKKLGYSVVNMESGFVVTEQLADADRTIDVSSPNEFEIYILRYSFLMLVDMLRLTNYARLKSQVSQLPLVAEEKSPKFAFVHIVSPHPPYIVDENGNKTTSRGVSDSWEPRAHYISQLKYISGVVSNFISDLLARHENPPVIVLQSDHGPWINDEPGNVYAARTGILNAFFVPGTARHKLYPAISPVNTFRLLFSELYGQDFPLLRDSSVSYESISRSAAFRLHVTPADRPDKD